MDSQLPLPTNDQIEHAKHVPAELRELYQVYEVGHASAILSNDFPKLFSELCVALGEFRFSKEQLLVGGGNESLLTKSFQKLLDARGWREAQLVHRYEFDQRIFKEGTRGSKQKSSKHIADEKTEAYSSSTHKIDFLKGRVAIDFEWNSKDQTFDRDLLAFRSFWELGRISVGVLITRGADMAGYLKDLGISKKYGASTTHIDKLIPRLEAGRHGGCPILVFGITPRLENND